jgi:ubiquinone/menaquinone biosynthesis C-methylase UbiE
MVSVTAAGYTCDTTRRMAEGASRHLLRATFDAGADGYDAARPVAPPEVFDDLVEQARLAPGSRVLEIGCGTGQATLPLAARKA